MSHVLSWDVKENGALIVLKGAPFSILLAYDAFADDYGNSWASTSNDKEKPGALNKATGYCHEACVDARKLLVVHHCLEPLPRETIATLYSKRPRGLRPPANADVYHVTGVIRTCADPECTCRKNLQVEGEDLSVFHTCRKNRHDLSSIPGTDSLEGDTSSRARPNIFTVYEQEIGMITPTIASDIEYWATIVPEAWIEEALKLASTNNARNWAYALAIVKRWKAQGKDDGKRNGSKQAAEPQPQDTRALEQVRAMKRGKE